MNIVKTRLLKYLQISKKEVWLDPDFRKTPDTTKPYCCRCQKSVNKTALKITQIENEGSWDAKVIIDSKGKYYLGRDCAKHIGLI